MNKVYGSGGVRVEITKDHFDEVGQKIMNGIPAGLEFGGLGIEREAKANARVDTGRYRSSIGHSQSMLSKKGQAQGVSINPSDAIWNLEKTFGFIWLYVGTNVEYATDLEAKYGNLYKSMMRMAPLVMQGIRKSIEGSITII